MDATKIDQYSKQLLALLQDKGSLTSQEIRKELTELNQTDFSADCVYKIYKQVEDEVEATGFPHEFTAKLA